MEIRTAYRRLARENHPDKGGDTARMAEINAAYEAIRDGRIPEPDPGPMPATPAGWRNAWAPWADTPTPVYVQHQPGIWRRVRPRGADPLHGEPRPGEGPEPGSDQWLREHYPRTRGTNGTGM